MTEVPDITAASESSSSREKLGPSARSQDLSMDGHRNAAYYLQPQPSRQSTLSSAKRDSRVDSEPVRILKTSEVVFFRTGTLTIVFGALLLLCGILEAALDVIEPYYYDFWASIVILVAGSLVVVTAKKNETIYVKASLIASVLGVVVAMVATALCCVDIYWYDLLKMVCVYNRRDERYNQLPDSDKEYFIQRCSEKRGVPIVGFSAFFAIDMVSLVICIGALLVAVVVCIQTLCKKNIR